MMDDLVEVTVRRPLAFLFDGSTRSLTRRRCSRTRRSLIS